MKDNWKRVGKWIRRRRGWVTGAALLALAAVVFTLVNHPAIVGASATTRALPIYCVQRDNKCVSLSFDAACGNT